MRRHLRRLERAAERGDAFAQYHLGAYLASGDGVERNLRLAASWYRKAAAQKEPEAIYNLGLMYMLGEGVRINVARGLRMLESAAQPGSPDAQQFLGDVFDTGAYQTKRDPERAAYYYLQSLAAGYSRASLINALLQIAAEGGVKEAQKRRSTRAPKDRTV